MTTSERILVVDDDESLLHMMSSHLIRQGYSVERSADPLQALEILKNSSPFAVLVTDLMMPRLNGIQLLRQARQIDPRLEVVVITAAASVETAITAMREDGAFNYLMKPLSNIHELSLAVKRAAAYRQFQVERETLRLRAQAEAERLQSLVNNISDAIVAADAAGKITVVNPAAARLIGQDNLLGLDAEISLPRPLSALLFNWRITGATRPTTMELGWPANTVQMVSLAPIVGASGNQGWVMVIRDITHLKQLDDLKAHMLVDTANKIRLPLAQAMNLLTELSNPAALSPEKLSDTVFRLVKTWRRIQQWTDDLLDLAQYEAGLNLKKATVDLSKLINDVIAAMPLDALRNRFLKLDVDLAPNLPPVVADAALLRKVLQGLLTRAVARSEGGSTIHVTAREQEQNIWVTVSDGGAPIAEVDLPHIFDRSFISAAGGYDATGLELAIAKVIIERLGGQIWVSNIGPVGTTITVCLPRR
jgi:PAS domain S-box-containing protein